MPMPHRASRSRWKALEQADIDKAPALRDRSEDPAQGKAIGCVRARDTDSGCCRLSGVEAAVGCKATDPEAALRVRAVLDIVLADSEEPFVFRAGGFLMDIRENWKQGGSPGTLLTSEQMKAIAQLDWFETDCLNGWKEAWENPSKGRFSAAHRVKWLLALCRDDSTKGHGTGSPT